MLNKIPFTEYIARVVKAINILIVKSLNFYFSWIFIHFLNFYFIHGHGNDFSINFITADAIDQADSKFARTVVTSSGSLASDSAQQSEYSTHSLSHSSYNRVNLGRIRLKIFLCLNSD